MNYHSCNIHYKFDVIVKLKVPKFSSILYDLHVNMCPVLLFFR